MSDLRLRAPSFVPGGRRRLAVIGDGTLCDPTELWAGEEGELLTRCGGELVGGPVRPQAALLMARTIAAGGPVSTYAGNAMALLLLAWAAQEGGA